ncbi:tRNA-queuosine alpha-mannosyltransferase domain-containing protein [Spiribacter onubensis]|uniref:tRNA-queuosine alpha-mannosyltransferase n=1 Tax=Spiribacter onubensis TaxID=3122420 RepID=A0ABV3SBX0_9GAMM
MRRRILLLSAYQSDSHAWWVRWLQQAFPGIDWRLLTLPGRHFKWRIRGNPLSWLDEIESACRGADQVVATSMVDLATLRGLCPALARIPAIYYFHENQFAYPVGPGQRHTLEPRVVQLYGALAAERLVFNSDWNRRSFLAGVDALLGRMPDAVPAGVAARLGRRSMVLPVPIAELTRPATEHRDPRLIVWNHRWEYDKAPEVFARALDRLAADGHDFHLALLGARAPKTPAVLRGLEKQWAPRIVASGCVARSAYGAILHRAAIAVSTAIHEFQGLGMLEAASAGAAPLVPDALVYPEQYATAYRYPAGDADALATRLGQWLGEPPSVPDVSAWSEVVLRPSWAKVLNGE